MELYRFFRFAIEKMCKKKKSLNHLIIKKSGFRISHKKTHYQTKNPIITGVICQNNRLLAPLGYKKKIAILSKYPIEKSIKNKLQGINAYLSTIKNVNRSL